MFTHEKIQYIKGEYILGDPEKASCNIQRPQAAFVLENTQNVCIHFHNLFEYLNAFYLVCKYINLPIQIFYNIKQRTFCVPQFQKYANYYELPITIYSESENIKIESENIFVLRRFFNVSDITKEFLLFLRKNIINSNSFSHTKKILINRNPKRIWGMPCYRRLTKENIDFFISKGYEYHEIQDYSIEEQATLFNSATHIVASHGSALANIVYCNSGTKIIEINSAYNPTCYPRIAKILYQQIGIYLNYYFLIDDEYYNYMETIDTAEVFNPYTYQDIVLKDENDCYRKILNPIEFQKKEHADISEFGVDVQKLCKIV